MEIWKDIPGYESYYQASSLGKIKSLRCPNNTRNGPSVVFREKILKQKLDKHNSYRVELWKNGKHKTYLVHRLIATTFLENYIDTNLTVNHKDGNRKNNNIENLEWLSRADNIRHGFDHNLYSLAKRVKVKNKETGEEKIYRSQSEASLAIGKGIGYMCGKKLFNKFENAAYIWEFI